MRRRRRLSSPAMSSTHSRNEVPLRPDYESPSASLGILRADRVWRYAGYLRSLTNLAGMPRFLHGRQRRNVKGVAFHFSPTANGSRVSIEGPRLGHENNNLENQDQGSPEGQPGRSACCKPGFQGSDISPATRISHIEAGLNAISSIRVREYRTVKVYAAAGEVHGTDRSVRQRRTVSEYQQERSLPANVRLSSARAIRPLEKLICSATQRKRARGPSLIDSRGSCCKFARFLRL